jgi:hypothetical protein
MKNTTKNQLKQYCLFSVKTSQLPLAVFIILLIICFLPNHSLSKKLILNDLEYFEKQGENILVYNNQFDGMFFDEKTEGIEIIHHGVRK